MKPYSRLAGQTDSPVAAKPIVHWFSPLPPARTDIANYTRRLLPALAAHSDLHLWTTQTEWDPELEQWATVQRWDAHHDWRALNSGTIAIYHMGNNALFHREIWEIARQHPGLVVLHDLCLQHFFLGTLEPEAYRRAMHQHYGPSGAEAARAWQESRVSVDTLAMLYPLGPHALSGALGAVVHTPETDRALRAAQRWPILHRPLPYPAQPLPAAPATATATSMEPGDSPRPWAAPGLETTPSSTRRKRLVMFGFMGANRRVDAVLKALAEFPHREALVLELYGQIDALESLKPWLTHPHLRERVTVHGFVSEAVLDQALATADLALNLRYPSMGEASGSQLRIWNHGLASLVTRTGWYASLPESTVGFVDPGNEQADLHRHFQALLDQPEHYRALGLAGQVHLQHAHDPVDYARAVLDFAIDCQAWRPWAGVDRLTQRLVEAMPSDSPLGQDRRQGGQLTQRCAHHLWELLAPEGQLSQPPRT